MENLSILITGGAGFIGSNIAESVLKQGVKKVRILDNLMTGKMENIQFLLDKYENLEFMYGDITNLESCRKAIHGIDIITHQAALGSVPRSVKDPLSSHINNVNGFLNILISAKEADIKRIVYASSSSVYGDHPVLPKVEENTGNVLSPYAATKAIDEIYASVFTRCYGMECIGLRYFNIFGPRQDPNGVYAAVIPKFIALMREGKSPVINGDGSFSRDFTYVDNAVQANILALTTSNNRCFGEAFNIGAGGQTSILELVNTINKCIGSEIKPIFGDKREGDIPHSNADINKAVSMLGYKSSINFEEGMTKLINSIISETRKNNDVKLEDINFNYLLNRQPIEVDNLTFKKTSQDSVILITGGCGSIGSEIVNQLLNLQICRLVIYDYDELSLFNTINHIKSYYKDMFETVTFILGDIRDKKKLEETIKKYDVNIIFHAAAYKHVVMLEKNYTEAIKTNIFGSKNIADLALKYNCEKMILVSTDKAVNPTNIMGCSKRIAELYINDLNRYNKTKFITTRFGNVLGSSGSVIPTFINKLNKDEDLDLTHKDIIRYFMTISEAAQLVIKAADIGNYYDILLFDMGKPIKIYDLAYKLIKKYSQRKDTKINIIGLRNGEKLYEELLCETEICEKTLDNNIMRSKHTKVFLDQKFFNRLNELKNNIDYEEIEVIFKELVPEFNHLNNRQVNKYIKNV